MFWLVSSCREGLSHAAIEWYVRVGMLSGTYLFGDAEATCPQRQDQADMLLRKGQSGNWVPANRWKGSCPRPRPTKRRHQCRRPAIFASRSCTPRSAHPFLRDPLRRDRLLHNRRPHRLPCQMRRRRTKPQRQCRRPPAHFATRFREPRLSTKSLQRAKRKSKTGTKQG